VTTTRDTPVSAPATIDAGPLTPELIDVVAWSDRLPSAAAAIDVPVRATLAEHDNIWQSDEAARTALRQRFTQSPSIRVEPFPRAGHSIELHRGARAYALRQLAFAEECLSALWQQRR
jgi:hypothetical protein